MNLKDFDQVFGVVCISLRLLLIIPFVVRVAILELEIQKMTQLTVSYL